MFVDLRASDDHPERKPDGSVVDAAGYLRSAQWGLARVARYSPEGAFLSAIDLPTGHTSCPAFEGQDFQHLFVTTARQKLPENHPEWFVVHLDVLGSAEPHVILK